MALLLAMWLLGCTDDVDCAAVYGPGSLSVAFTVAHPDAIYHWTVTGESDALSCRLTLTSGDGVIGCDGASAVIGPERFAPVWEAVAEEGACADHLQGIFEFDLR